MSKIIDIHSHLIPFVDDGVKSFDESLLMLKEMIDQNVESVIITPHNQSQVTKKTREEQSKLFLELQSIVLAEKLDIKIYFGSELRYRRHLTANYNEHLLADSNYLLLEFSSRREESIEEVVFNLSRSGFKPIIAHIERYPYLDFKDYLLIKSSGGLIQVNASAVLGLDGKKIQRLVMKMLKENLIDFIATDTHNMDTRVPNLRAAYNYLEKRIDKEYLNKIFYSNAKQIVE